MIWYIVIIYSILAFIWSIFAVYKIRKFGRLGKLFVNQLTAMVINFIGFPYCLYYAIKHKKI